MELDLSDELIQHVRRDLLPKVRDCAIFLSVCPAEDEVDVNFLIQLGAAVWLGKPILAVGLGGVRVPDGLRAIAVQSLDQVRLGTPEGDAQLMRAIKALAGTTKGQKPPEVTSI